jgi:hypothetical protein
MLYLFCYLPADLVAFWLRKHLDLAMISLLKKVSLHFLHLFLGVAVQEGYEGIITEKLFISSFSYAGIKDGNSAIFLKSVRSGGRIAPDILWSISNEHFKLFGW